MRSLDVWLATWGMLPVLAGATHAGLLNASQLQAQLQSMSVASASVDSDIKQFSGCMPDTGFIVVANLKDEIVPVQLHVLKASLPEFGVAIGDVVAQQPIVFTVDLDIGWRVAPGLWGST